MFFFFWGGGRVPYDNYYTILSVQVLVCNIGALLSTYSFSFFFFGGGSLMITINYRIMGRKPYSNY